MEMNFESRFENIKEKLKLEIPVIEVKKKNKTTISINRYFSSTAKIKIIRRKN